MNRIPASAEKIDHQTQQFKFVSVWKEGKGSHGWDDGDMLIFKR